MQKSQSKGGKKDTNKEGLDWKERQEVSRATNLTLVYTSSHFCQQRISCTDQKEAP